MTISETVEWFNSIFDINKDATNERSKFYCGITDDVERRQEEHHVAKFLGVTRCDTFDTAKEVEKQMKKNFKWLTLLEEDVQRMAR